MRARTGVPVVGFVSIVLVVADQLADLDEGLAEVANVAASIADDYELIVVDNASTDMSVTRLRELTGEDGLPNLQVFSLTKAVDMETASWVGIENALGDYVAVIDLRFDDIDFLPTMMLQMVDGTDVVFAESTQGLGHSFAYRSMYRIFSRAFRSITGVDLRRDAPKYRLLSRRVVNFIVQHPHPEVAYRHLPITGGFARANLRYEPRHSEAARRRVLSSLDPAASLLVSTSKAPLRIVLFLCLIGAAFNVVYSIYVVAVALLKADVAPGWTSLSLQQSGMFFLLSLVLFVLGEYVLYGVSVSTDGPTHHVREEFASVRITGLERLNVDVVDSTWPADPLSDESTRRPTPTSNAHKTIDHVR